MADNTWCSVASLAFCLHYTQTVRKNLVVGMPHNVHCSQGVQSNWYSIHTHVGVDISHNN